MARAKRIRRRIPPRRLRKPFTVGTLVIENIAAALPCAVGTKRCPSNTCCEVGLSMLRCGVPSLELVIDRGGRAEARTLVRQLRKLIKRSGFQTSAVAAGRRGRRG